MLVIAMKTLVAFVFAFFGLLDMTFVFVIV